MTGTSRENSAGYDPIDDAVFGALRSRRRRYVLYVLLAHESISRAELADAVTGWTGIDEPGMVSPDQREDVSHSLVHRHLPVLEDAGLLAWNDETDTISRTDWPEGVSALVEMALEEETDVT
ncbi:DUF7344 domain-containing protein [Natrialbaceae archaeon A-gly3]